MRILLTIIALLSISVQAKDIELRNNSGSVYYEIFIRSFADSDGDGIGDINGIIGKLDYLQQLGIHGIWLTPFHQSPSYHKYDVVDYASVDKEYGTIDDVRKLINEAHKRDISIIMDFVVNHTSNQHPWFLDAVKNPVSKFRNYYIWASEAESHRWQAQPYNQGLPWQWHKVDSGNIQAGRYYGFFWRGMPDLNYDNPEVRKEIIKYGTFWLRDIGIDGFRLDAAQHIYDLNEHEKSRAWWNEFRSAMETINPNIYLVGEIVNSDSIVSGYFTGLKANFHFDLGRSIVNMVRDESIPANFVDGLAKSIQAHKQIRKDCIDAIFLTNHDQNRIMSELAGNQHHAAMAATILLTLPGQPFLYYGEEIGMMGQKPDESIREPIRWTQAGNNGTTKWRMASYHTEVHQSVDQALKDYASLFHVYKNAIAVRQNHAALLNGDLHVVMLNPALLSFTRSTKNEELLVIHNITSKEQSFSIQGYDIIETIALSSFKGNKPNVINPYSTIILKKK